MATKTAPKTDTAARLAEIEAQAARLREQADREQIERDRAAGEEAARHDAAAHAWWLERQRTFTDRTRGVIDEAWRNFREAVRQGRPDTLAAWVAYRRAVTVVQGELRAIRVYFVTHQRAAAEAALEQYRRVHEQGFVLAQVQVPRDLDPGEYRDRLAAYNRAASEYEGREFADDAPPRPNELTEPPRLPATLGLDVPTPDPHGVHSYGAAVDAVVTQLEQEAAADAEAARRAELDAL
ncbi:MAG: hypothetical protein ACRDP8_20230 [Actinopolymorphaceae bacterium]